MEFIFGLLMGTRFFAMLTGGLPGEPEVFFAPPRIIITQSYISMTVELKKPYPAQLRQLAQTSTPIMLYAFMELYEKGDRSPVAKATAESVLFYDIIGKRYRIVKSPAADTLDFSNLDSAIIKSSFFENIALCPRENIVPEKEYYFVAYAILGKTIVEALNSKSIDLMYYWNYKRPLIKTESYEGAVLKQALIKQ